MKSKKGTPATPQAHSSGNWVSIAMVRKPPQLRPVTRDARRVAAEADEEVVGGGAVERLALAHQPAVGELPAPAVAVAAAVVGMHDRDAGGDEGLAQRVPLVRVMPGGAAVDDARRRPRWAPRARRAGPGTSVRWSRLVNRTGTPLAKPCSLEFAGQRAGEPGRLAVRQLEPEELRRVLRRR